MDNALSICYILHIIITQMQATALFVHDVNVLLVVNGTVLGIHHLVVFVLLVIIYSKLLRHIKQIRKEFGKLSQTYLLGICMQTVGCFQSKG